MYDESLPYTGAGLAVGGQFVGLPIIISGAIALIAGGLLIYRYATRGRRAQTRP